ncbi:sugar kinase [Rathayibacter sp. Leaf296]|uniref:sugar kinase n=1 Tax=Rathayibacter sp. Leaf296 TaxID=1736327 RepID=UPI0009EA5CC1|nr:sugar kinase [Rathayibacter sp. Leaf296]
MTTGAAAEVLCVGEAMVLGVPTDGAGLAGTASVSLHVAGAEANVAAGLAALGVEVEWWSRVGADPLGARVLAELVGRGIDCSAVVTDQDAPTGLYLKDPSGGGTRVHYYRRGSAASAMAPDDQGRLRVDERRVIHLSGITAAISPSADALVGLLVDLPPRPGRLVAFDVNHRPALWPDRATAADRLRHLADAADLVLVGRDEAEELWGTADAAAIRALLARPRLLVVKDADVEATAFVRTAGVDTVVSVPAPRVEVVEATGAGDAFAAGFLAALLAGAGARRALTAGHRMAGSALRTVGDLPRRLDPDLVADLARGGGPSDRIPLETR